MRRRRARRVLLTLALAAGAVSVLPVPSAQGDANSAADWAGTWSSLPTPAGVRVASGTLTTDGTTPSTSATVVLFVEPADFSAVESGAEQFTPLSRSATDGAGNWSLSVPPGTDLTKNTSPSGMVNFEVRSFDGVGSGSYFFSAKAASSLAAAQAESSGLVAAGSATVAGAAKTLATLPGESAGIKLNSAMSPNSTATGAAPATTSDPIYQCANGSFQLYGNIRVRIGRLYSESPTAAEQFTYTRGSSSTLGIGFSGSGAAGSWSASGTTTTDSSDRLDYPLMRGVAYKLAYTTFQYDKWIQTCRSYPGGYVVSTDHYFGPSRWIGGQNWENGNRLGMGNCLQHPAGSHFTKDRSTAYEGGADVASSGAIQINLSARTGYSTSTSITFGFTHTQPLCGYRDYEGGTPQLLTVHGPL
jgi:hypothetical protein